MTRKISPMVLLTALSVLALGMECAQAAPQILGLVASNGIPTPLRCEGGLCSGFVSSFCLQFERPSPVPDSEYLLAQGGGITLVGQRADGSALRLSAGSLVTIRSRAGYSSVTISLPETELDRIGVVTAEIEIAPLTSVLPVAIAGDSDPQTPREIDLATGPQRRLAQSTFEIPGQRSDAARVIALVVNNLPTDEPTTPIGREAIWRKAVMLAASTPLDPQGFVDASRIYQNCGTAVDARTASSLSACMQQAQQDLMGALEFELQGQSAVGHMPDEGASGT
jgi:hypothetical protein